MSQGSSCPLGKCEKPFEGVFEKEKLVVALEVKTS